MWSLCVDYISSTMGHVCVMWLAYLLWAFVRYVNICIPVFLVTLLIVLSSCVAYILTLLSHRNTQTYWHIFGI